MGYNYADPSAENGIGVVLSWCPKSSLPEVGFLILQLPEYGSLIDTTIADKYRCRLFIESAYTIGTLRGTKDLTHSRVCMVVHAQGFDA